MFAGKPIIGIVGGIGSGKSFVAGLFGEAGCRVIDSDQQIRQAYDDPEIRRTLRSWWGGEIFDADGHVNRSAVAGKVFADDTQRRRLEGLLHPWIARQRDRIMQAAAADPQVLAFVWDAPLLFEADLHQQCDAVVFVDAPLQTRLARVRETRGWGPDELKRREKSQLPLDNKREMSEYTVENTADADYARSQVRDVLSRILANSSGKRNRE